MKIKKLILVQTIICCHLLQIVVILDNKVIQEVYGMKVSFYINLEFFINAKA